MNLFDSPVFVFCLLVSPVGFSAITLFLNRNSQDQTIQKKNNVKLATYFLLAFTFVDIYLSLSGNSGWETLFHTSQAVPFWIAMFLSPIYIYYESIRLQEKIDFFGFLIAFAVIWAALGITISVVQSLYHLFITVTYHPQ